MAQTRYYGDKTLAVVFNVFELDEDRINLIFSAEFPSYESECDALLDIAKYGRSYIQYFVIRGYKVEI